MRMQGQDVDLAGGTLIAEVRLRNRSWLRPGDRINGLEVHAISSGHGYFPSIIRGTLNTYSASGGAGARVGATAEAAPPARPVSERTSGRIAYWRPATTPWRASTRVALRTAVRAELGVLPPGRGGREALCLPFKRRWLPCA